MSREIALQRRICDWWFSLSGDLWFCEGDESSAKIIRDFAARNTHIDIYFCRLTLVVSAENYHSYIKSIWFILILSNNKICLHVCARISTCSLSDSCSDCSRRQSMNYSLNALISSIEINTQKRSK